MARLAIRLSLLAALLTACGIRVPAPTATQAPASAVAAPTLASTARPAATPVPAPTTTAESSGLLEGPVAVSGVFTYSNDIITIYYYQHAVALLDMHAFVIRDMEWELPVESQVLGHLALDEEARQGAFRLLLPAQPAGQPSDVDQDGSVDEGVQVFAVGYAPNLTGGPFSEGDDRSTGWPTYLASVRTDSENDREVIGGKLIVWSPEAGHTFPSAFGDDGLLFTDDDPLTTLEAGYTVVDLDETPFAFIRDPDPEVTLHEPTDAAVKDYSAMSYSEAFDLLYERASIEWAFNGIESKQVDWPALYAEIAPRVAEAERDQDPEAYFKALQAFSYAIPDGHVSLSGDLATRDFLGHIVAGYGFTVREMDDGRVLVVFVARGGPADLAGMLRGAELLEFDGLPAGEAITRVEPVGGPFSLESSRRYQQMRDLLRAPLGREASIVFANPGGPSQSVTLRAAHERESYFVSSIFSAPDPMALPVETRILDSGVGYLKLNTNYDDLALILRLFERGLESFKEAGVSHLILDLRQNSGGAPLGLAGFFTDQEIELGRLEYYSEKTGQFEPRGRTSKVTPNENQYDFDRLAVLIGPACASACEIEAYAFSQLPGAIMVGTYPTAGVEAEVLRGQFLLPEGLRFQMPTGRFMLPDGSLWLEGVGVLPTVRVPLDETTLLSGDDVELLTAEEAVLGLGAGSLRLAGGPLLLSANASRQAVNDGANFLEDLALEDYGLGNMPGTSEAFTYTVDIDRDERLIWLNGWCADTQAILQDNMQKMEVEFLFGGQTVERGHFAVYAGLLGEQQCHLYYTAAMRWPTGETRLETRITFLEPVNDGQTSYAAGTVRYVYVVTRR